MFYTYTLLGALVATISLKFSFAWEDPKLDSTSDLAEYFNINSSSAVRNETSLKGLP